MPSAPSVKRIFERLATTNLAKIIVGRLNTLAQRAGPWRIRLDGHVYYFSTLDRLVVLWLQRLGHGENYALEVWKELCGSGHVVLDVGANLGLYTLTAAREVGKHGKVLAFEADPENASLLLKTSELSGYTNITCVAAAAADKNGEIRLYQRPEHKGDSQLFYQQGGRPSQVVPSTTLDSALAPDHRVDLIKFDIQGSEAFAIKGITQILSANLDLKVLTEFWPAGLERCRLNPEDYLGWWRGHGFTIRLVDEKQRKLINVTDDRSFTQWVRSQKESILLLERG